MKRILRRLNAVFTRPVTAWLLAFGSVAIGAVVSIWPFEIRDATKTAVLGPRGGVDWWVVSFWVAALGWAYILFLRLKSDHQVEDDRVATLLRAINKVPNYRVIQNYHDWYTEAADAVAQTVGTQGSPQEQLRAIEAGIKAVLTLASGMASEFSRAEPASSYGANIMLIARPRNAPESAFHEDLIKSLRFYDKQGGDPRTLRAILYLPERLLMTHEESRPERQIPLISLPVPQSAKTVKGHRLALPGAPWAVLEGTQSVQEDTRLIADDCVDFAMPIIEEIEAYFSEAGDGKDVRSFVSYRLGDESEPIGVLNIDSNRPHVLGPEVEYHPTFYALITPLLRLLRKPVNEYARLSSQHGQYLHPVAQIQTKSNDDSTPATQPSVAT